MLPLWVVWWGSPVWCGWTLSWWHWRVCPAPPLASHNIEQTEPCSFQSLSACTHPWHPQTDDCLQQATRTQCEMNRWVTCNTVCLQGGINMHLLSGIYTQKSCIVHNRFQYEQLQHLTCTYYLYSLPLGGTTTPQSDLTSHCSWLLASSENMNIKNIKNIYIL